MTPIVMTADRWQRTKAIASEAWSRPVAERIAYVTRACADDVALCNDVLSLVAAMAAAEHRFETPVLFPASVTRDRGSLVGQRVGPYEILSRIGSGGMGEVYQARDTRLDRIVAIKIISAGTPTDSASRDRMEHEARAVAALKHPHICTLHDIGSDAGHDFLVMEYLDGETLAARLARERLPVAEALEYADQIGSALDEAHRSGIIHGDVKPGNIMLTRDAKRSTGVVHAKLLDFGLANTSPVHTPVGPAPPAPDPSPDLSTLGFVLGTAPYLAPEQFAGKAKDERSDIFAFGAVLFEMLTGRKAFEGTNQAQMLAAIRDEHRPRVSDHRQDIPSALDRVVSRCLARSPDERYPSVQDLVTALRSVRRGLDSSSRIRTLLIIAAASVLVIAATTTWVMRAGRDVGASVSPSVTRLTGSAGAIGEATLSPDGSSVIFSWIGDGFTSPELVLLRIGSTSRVRLTNDLAVEEWPAWSPDGTQIAFVGCEPGRCGIFTLPIAGREKRKLLDVRADRYFGLAWSPDGKSIAYAERRSSSESYALFLLSLDTLATRRLTLPKVGLGILRFAFSPDGKTLAIIRVEEAVGVHLLSVASGADTVLLGGLQEWFGGLAWTADGRDLILSGNQGGARRLWTLPVTGGGLEPLAIAGENAYYPSVSSRGGRMTFIHEFHDWDLWRLPLDSGQARATSFPSSTRLDLDPAFSPDGRKLAFISERGGTRELWVSNADGSETRQLTSLSGEMTGKPSWSPDGRLLAFHGRGIKVVPADGGPVLTLSPLGEMPTWSSDGQWIYFRHSENGRFYVFKIPAHGGSAVQAIASAAAVAREAPQRGDLYFVGGNGGIWRRSVADGAETLVIPEFKHSMPGYWTVVSDGIYYVAEERHPDQTVSYRLRFFDFARRRTASVGTLAGILDDWVGGLTVSPDRRILLYSQRAYQTREVMLVEHLR